MALASVAEAGNVCALRGFLPLVILIDVVTVNAIRIAEIVADVDGALIDVYVGAGRAEEGRCAVERSISCRYEGQQILRDGVRAGLNCGAISVAQDGGSCI